MADRIDPLSRYLANNIGHLQLKSHDLTRSRQELSYVADEYRISKESELLTFLSRQGQNHVKVDKFNLRSEDYKKFCDYETKSKKYENAIKTNTRTIEELKSAIQTLSKPNGVRPSYATMQAALENLSYSRITNIFNGIDASATQTTQTLVAEKENKIQKAPEDITTELLAVPDKGFYKDLAPKIRNIVQTRHGDTCADLVSTKGQINWEAIECINIYSTKSYDHIKTVELINGAIIGKFNEFISKLKHHNEILEGRRSEIDKKKDELVTISKSDITQQLARNKSELNYIYKQQRDEIVEEQQELVNFFSLLEKLQALWSNFNR